MLQTLENGGRSCYNERMDEFDVRKSIISQEDMADCLDFVTDFSAQLKEYSGRLTGSDSETACARAIRNRLHDETDAKTRLEAFMAYPMWGRQSFLLVGLWFALSYVLYYVSFAGGRITGILLTLLSLAVFAVGTGVLFSLYFGCGTFKGVLSKKACYNVVSEFGSENSDKVFVICDHHDDMPGSIIKDFDIMRKFCTIIAPLSMFVFVLFCILKMALGTQDGDIAAKTSAFAIIPTVFGILGITTIVLHYSPMPKHARNSNGISTSIAMATYAYFVDKSELLPPDVKIVYASFGGENSAHCGSRAFAEAHPEFAKATVLCIDDIQSGDIELAEYDAVRKIEYDMNTVAAVLSSAREQELKISVMPHTTFKEKFNSLHGFMSNAFARTGNPTVTVLAKEYGKAQRNLSAEEIENLFSLTVGTMQNLMKHDSSQNKTDAEIHIVDAVGR